MQTYIKHFILSVIAIIALIPELSGQTASDTIVLRVHRVIASKSSAYHSGAQQESLDRQTMTRFENRSLGDALLENTLVSIKNYGTPGSLSTASLRGLSSNHVQINWNGIALNSLTTGDFNLGQIPTGAFDEASYTPNASGALYGSGTFGGAIDLVSVSKNKKSFAAFSTETTSLNSISTLNKIARIGEKLSFSATAWFQSWKNNYPYYDISERKTLKRQNAEYSTNGMILSSSYSLKPNQVLGAGIWLQEADKNLPALNGTPPQHVEFQHDNSLRSYISYQLKSETSILSSNAVYVNDFMHYGKKVDVNQEDLSVDSKIRSIFALGNIDYQYYGFNPIKFIGGVQYKYAVPKSNNFAENLWEQSVSIFASAKYVHTNFTTSVSVRQDYYSNYEDPILLGLGGEFFPLKDRLKLHLSINQKYRIPTFNERYWQDLGNPDLEPEKGISYETGLSILPLRELGYSEFKITAYYNQVNGLIRWLTVNGKLGPHTYSDVHAQGLELSYRNKFSFLDYFKLNNTTLFGLNSTTQQALDNENIDPSRQLPYTPKYKFVHTTYFFYKNAGLRFNYSYVGQQHYDDTDWWMPAIHTLNLSFLFETQIYDYKTNFDISIDNLRGTIHEHIKGYPGPGRIYRIKLNINI